MRSLQNGISFAAAAGAVVLASCSGGGGSPAVTYSPASNYASATPAATSSSTAVRIGATASPTVAGSAPAGTATATATPTASPGGTSPSMRPSASPSATATATMVAVMTSPMPTASPTTASTGPTAAQCSAQAQMNASGSYAAATSNTQAIPMQGGVPIPLPTYEDSSGSSVTIAYTTASGGSSNVTTTVGYNNFDGVNTSNIPSNQTIVAYSSLQLDTTVMFQQQKSTEVTSISPCDYTSGSTYYVTVDALGTTTQPNGPVDSFDASTSTITFPLVVPGNSAPYTFPAGTTADIVISKTTP